jgi:CheY-like chemotaxis protein
MQKEGSMQNEVTILIAEDDDGHAALIQRNLRRAGVDNEIIRFADGQETLSFLLREGPGPHRKPNGSYLLLLDIRMPGIDGVEVLQRIRENNELKKLPVLMLTTTDDPKEVERCHQLGCSIYIVKPIEYEQFVAGIRKLGGFLVVVRVPAITDEL